MSQDIGIRSGERCLVLLSGGLDSTTCLGLAVDRFGQENVVSVSFYYGQKHGRELEVAQRMSNMYGVDNIVINLPEDPFRGGGSALVDRDVEIKATTYREMIAEQGIANTYVPFRNGTLLSFSTAVALTKKCQYIYYGAHAEDARNWAYPDCTPEFNGSMANAIFIGSNQKVRLVTPWQWMTKGEILQQAASLSVPVELTYSCYQGGEIHCGVCPTCVERKAAFEWAHMIDRTEYAQ